jgi:hypothetical protein
MIEFDGSLETDFKAIDLESEVKYGIDWREEGLDLSYCCEKMNHHVIAIKAGQKMDHSGVSHESKVYWWMRAIDHFLENDNGDEICQENLNG